MADPPLPRPAVEDLAHNILGWSSTQSTAAAEDSDEWKRLHAQVRTTSEGIEGFKLATKLLSGKEGRIVFKHADSADSSSRDPFSIVQAYFRLLRFSLESSETDFSILTEDEWTNYTKTLLKNLGSSLKSSIQQQIQYLNDSSQPSLDGQLAFYNRSSCKQRNRTILLYFQSVIDHVIPHVGRKMAKLVSLYKLFYEVAELFVTLLESECTKLGGLIQSFLPVVGWPALSNLRQDVDLINCTWNDFNNYLKQAVLSLVDAMHLGMKPVQKALEGEQSMNSKPDSYSKIIIFMMAKTVQLICLRRKRFQIRKACSSNMPSCIGSAQTRSSEDGEAEIISQCLLLLIKIRSISALVHGLLEEPSTNSQLDGNRNGLFEMLKGLGQKVDSYAAVLLCLDNGPAENGVYIGLGLECLANQQSEEFQVSLTTNGGIDESNTSENIFPLGKLFMIKHVLEKLDSSALTSSTTLIRLCQSTIFEDLPKVFHIFQMRTPHAVELPSWASRLIRDLVVVITDCSFAFFLSDSGDSSGDCVVRQHQLLIRWLMGGTPNHPFSNEVTTYILEARIMTSKTNQDRNNLLFLMTKLLFHPRTQALHRRRIATVLARLLRSANYVKLGWNNEIDKVKAATMQIIWKELKRTILFGSPSLEQSTSGKRKRKVNLEQLAFIADSEVLKIIALLGEASMSSQVPIDNTAQFEIRQLWDNVVSGKSSSVGKGKLDSRQLLAISLLAGMMRCRSNIASIQHMLNGQDAITSASPSLFIDGSLALIASIASAHSKTRVPSQYYVCVQFVCSLVSLTGRDFSESQLLRLGDILTKINTAKSNMHESDKIRVEHLLVSTCCKLGHVIQPTFSSGSVKPFVGIISQYLARGDWFYTAPGVSMSEMLVTALPNEHKPSFTASMAKDAQLLLSSRIRQELFCLETRQTIDISNSLPYSLDKESTHVILRTEPVK